MPVYDGLLLCDKPYSLSSHDVINKLRRILKQKKIGHTGTLDPRATGLMVTCLGRATKISQFLTFADKTYLAEIKLGQISTTYDSEGVIKDSTKPVPELTRDKLETILDQFRGTIEQQVPAFSAIKINGERSYKLARKGAETEMPIREVEIKELVIEEIDLPIIRCRVTCSKGTYIRALAHDIGEKIGCGGYLANLRRINVGQYDIRDALTLDDIEANSESGEIDNFIIPIESALSYPSIRVKPEFAEYVITGRTPSFTDLDSIEGDFDIDQLIVLRDGDNKIIAIGKAQMKSQDINENENNSFFKYVRVLN